MNRDLELHSGGIFEGFITCPEWKALSSHYKKKKKNSAWVHVLMATHSKTKGCTKIVQNTWWCHYKGVSVGSPANGKNTQRHRSYASSWTPLLLSVAPLCWSYRFLSFSLLFFVPMEPLLTHPFSGLAIPFSSLFEACESYFSHRPLNFLLS